MLITTENLTVFSPFHHSIPLWDESNEGRWESERGTISLLKDPPPSISALPEGT